jgi:hypothetical protein
MTYVDIIQAPNYKKLLSMGLKDITGPTQKKNLTIMFVKPGSVGKDPDPIRYTVHQNGYVRRGKTTRWDPSDWRLVPMGGGIGSAFNAVEDYDKAFIQIIQNVEGVRKTPEKVRRTESDKIAYFAENFPKTIIIDVLENNFIFNYAKDRAKHSGKSVYAEMYNSAKNSSVFLKDMEKKRSS